ncbi:MAG TPA: sporulation inhibitor of replication protein SirA [Bacillota bacterium]
MKVYDAYLIKKEFAEHYFYRADILCRFIKAYENDPTRDDLARQFAYITNRFPKAFFSHIKNDYLNKNNFNKINDYQLEIYCKNHHIALHLSEKKLRFLCESIHDAEALLFPPLRSLYPYLFIVGEEMNDYGWMEPIREKLPFIKKEQVLYSYN